jgi:shikimate kinase
VNVVLTGFMGAGKTSTGKRLAGLLGLPFIDTDVEIERRHGAIAAIFTTQGEAAFRRIESAVIAEAVGTGPAVVAVGGGAVLDEQNRKLLRRLGYIVHLAISPRSALRRTSGRRRRPLLGETPGLESVSSLLARRATAYADCDLEIAVDRQTPLETARIIARWYHDKQSESSIR